MNILLLPYKFKLIGVLITLAGIVMAVIYKTMDFQIKLPVFAIVSAFLETKFLTSFSTNVADEIVLVVLMTGLAMIMFSKERNERAGYDLLRSRAMFRAVMLNAVLMLLTVLFTYGFAFVSMLLFNLFSISLIYLALFYLSLRRAKSNNREDVATL